MGRRSLALLGAVAASFVLAPGSVEYARNGVRPHAPCPVTPEAQALHDDRIVAGLHADDLLWNRHLAERGSYGQVDLPRLIEGGIALQVFAALFKSPAGQS
ncbi:hypothetical protein [Sedimentitalea todarodis]|uniref:Uncharacterized protein n=1 Tax=Sedimentitalea todarodis TaxID=1631240 RepID=A0ABU3V969_9RHOB|nr:hypothetical protein [Sedimentitalea todarodis]MDU9002704.1 hypothetical protein [Sedimentitalea todarodis]